MATSKLRKSLQAKLRRVGDWHTENSVWRLHIKKTKPNTYFTSIAITLPAFAYHKTSDDRRISIAMKSSDGSKSLVSYISVKELNLLCEIINEFCREADEFAQRWTTQKESKNDKHQKKNSR